MAGKLWVGPGEAYPTLAAAVAAANADDTIYVRAGVYENQHAVIDKDLTIVGVDGYAHFKSGGNIPNKKGILVVEGNYDLDVSNLILEGARVGSGNGAGIRFQGNDLTVDNVKFIDNTLGILAGRYASHDKNHSLAISNSEFEGSGSSPGTLIGHAIYAADYASLKVTNSDFSGTRVGHHIKSRAYETVVEGNELRDGGGNSSYAVDAPNLGNVTVRGNYLQQSPAGAKQNPDMINYGGEVRSNQPLTQKPGTLLVEDNVFVNDASNGTAVRNRSDRPAELNDNAFWNVGNRLSGPGSDNDGRNLGSRPDGLSSGTDADVRDDVVDDGGDGGLVKDDVVEDDVVRDDVVEDDVVRDDVVEDDVVRDDVVEDDVARDDVVEDDVVRDDVVEDDVVRDDVVEDDVVRDDVVEDDVSGDYVLLRSDLITSYGSGQDKAGAWGVSADGLTLSLAGNRWKKMGFDYDVTRDTVLELEFRSTGEGEIQGIGFETDNAWKEADNFFQVHGTQSGNWNRDHLIDGDGTQWRKVVIDVGSYVTGEMDYLVFLHDDDDRSPDAASQFRNIRVYEHSDADAGTGTAGDDDASSRDDTPQADTSRDDTPQDDTPQDDAARDDTARDDTAQEFVGFRSDLITSYGSGQDKAGSWDVSGDGLTLSLAGNRWKKMGFDYDVTRDTVLELEFRSTGEGEIQGIGFETDNAWKEADNFFQVHGTQSGNWNRDHLIDGDGTQWRKVVIDVGSYVTGEMDYLVFLHDDDDRSPDAASQFRNIRVYEHSDADAGPALVDEDMAPLRAFPVDEDVLIG